MGTISWGIFGWISWEIPPITHIFLSDILYSALACVCTFLAIHINRYVGVMDIDSCDMIYVVKRKGDGKIRDIHQHDIYNLNKNDPDRVFSQLDNDNEIRKDLNQLDPDRVLENMGNDNQIQRTLNEEDPDRIM